MVILHTIKETTSDLESANLKSVCLLKISWKCFFNHACVGLHKHYSVLLTFW